MIGNEALVVDLDQAVHHRALAVAELHGAQAGLEALPEPSSDARLAEYQPYWATRAELLSRTDARSEAWDAYEMAIGLERDAAVRRFLQGRQARLETAEAKASS